MQYNEMQGDSKEDLGRNCKLMIIMAITIEAEGSDGNLAS
jgi:hypothetical protein